MRKVVVIVGMLDSVHLARWLGLFLNCDIDFWLFPSSPSRRLHPLIRELIQNRSGARYRADFASRGLLPIIIWCCDKLFANRIGSRILRRRVMHLNPQVIHALEFQHAGYLVVDTLKRMNPHDRPTFVATNYGSDVYWFRQFEAHRHRLLELLSLVDKYAAECHRDVEIAREMGYRGSVLPVLPNFGGIAFSDQHSGIVSAGARSKIAVKGYHGWVGRAHVALRALRKMAPEVEQFEIVVYSCNLSTRILAKWISISSGLKIRSYSKSALSVREMSKLFSESRIYVGLSLSDGISTSLIESMAYGAIPVQTATSCCDEWFEATGVRVTEISVDSVVSAIRKALNLSLSGTAAEVNAATVKARASREVISSQAQGFYD